MRRSLETIGAVNLWDDERPIPRNELLTRIREADALLCMRDDQITAEVLAAAPRLAIICTASVGADHIDLRAAAARGILVCNAPSAADAVADLTLALLLACARHLVEADLFVKTRRWQYWHPDLYLGNDLRGSTLGIIGLGQIGLQVAHRATGFSMRILYADSHRHLDAERSLRVQYGRFEDVLREADFVTLHVPLLPSTRGLIGETQLRLMKPTAYLINTARGPVVEHQALIRALTEGWIAGAGLDVFVEEPLASDDPLLSLPNVVLSPHIGANTRKTLLTMLRVAVEQMFQFWQGHLPAHLVTPREDERAA